MQLQCGVWGKYNVFPHVLSKPETWLCVELPFWLRKVIFSGERIPAFVKSGVGVVGTFRFGLERSCDYPLGVGGSC